jgi:hypothetical protein
MDCRYVRIEEEEAYVRRLWELTAPNPPAPRMEVSAAVICQDRPLLPLRWPPSGRKTENPEREFSPKGSFNLPGENYARDSKYALYLSSLLAGHGDPGRFFEEIRKEQANRRNGLLVSWLHVEYYRVPAGMRSSLYPRVPQDWDEWEAPRGMNVPLPAVLSYRGSGLIRGDPFHWCIFRTEWVIAIFARFIADAHHRGLLWRVPVKVTKGIESLGLETLVEGSPYLPEAAQNLLKLQAEFSWEGWIRTGYTALQAVPIQRVGDEFQICELPPSGVTENMAVSEDGSDHEELLASGEVRWASAPETPKSPELTYPTERGSGESAARRERTFAPVAGRREEQLRARLPSGNWEGRPGFSGSFRTQERPDHMAGDWGGSRRIFLPPTREDPHTAFEYSRGFHGTPGTEYIAVQEVEEYLRYHNRWEEMCEYTHGSPLTAAVVGRALCALLESRQYHRHRGADLTQQIQGLDEERRTRSLLDQATDQTLRLISTELTGLTERFHQQVVRSGVGREGDEIEEDTEGMGMRKRARTGP